MERLIGVLKSFYGMTATIGVIVPGFTFFTSYAPPMFEEISLITSALCVGVMVVLSNRKNRKSNGLKWLVVAFVLLVLYLFFLNSTTINIHDERWQAGFGTQRWSLTPEALKMIEAAPDCARSKEELLNCAGHIKTSVLRIWSVESIYLASGCLILVFTASSVIWTAGWTILARQQRTAV